MTNKNPYNITLKLKINIQYIIKFLLFNHDNIKNQFVSKIISRLLRTKS